MMDKTYILDNGILERHVLGELSVVEQEQLVYALDQYPELKDELSIIEEQFEKLASENAINVPSSVKAELFESIQKTSKPTLILQKKPVKTYFNVAASVAILLGITSIFMWIQLQETQKRLEVVEQENTNLNLNIKDLQSDLIETNTWYSEINDPDTKKYVLTGNSLMPEALIISYVNDSKKSVVVNTKNLPPLDDQHDYQMWADVEGEMINMGIIDHKNEMLAMTYIDHAESLNITIEPAGGNDHPTVSQLITNVYLK